MNTSVRQIIRYVYLYLITAITVIMVLISLIGVLDLVLKNYVFEVGPYEQFSPKYACDEFLMNNYETQEECQADQEKLNEARAVNDMKRSFAEYLAMFLVAFPLYWYHWGLIKKERHD